MNSPNDSSASDAAESPSQAQQESTLYHCSKGLYPRKSVKKPCYTPRYSENALRTPPPVFTPPGTYLQTETSFLQRDDKVAVSIADRQLNTHMNDMPIFCLDNDIQSSSLLGCIDQRLDQSLCLVDNTKSPGSNLLQSYEMPHSAHSDVTCSGGISSRQANNSLDENMLRSDSLRENEDSRSAKSPMLVKSMVSNGNDERMIETTPVIAKSNWNQHLVSAPTSCDLFRNAGHKYHNLGVSSRKLEDCLQFVKPYEDSVASIRQILDESNKILCEQQYGSCKHLQSKARVICNSNGSIKSRCRSIDSGMCPGEKLSSYPYPEEGKLGPDGKEWLRNDSTGFSSTSNENIQSLDNEHQECQVIEGSPCEGESSLKRSASEPEVDSENVRKRKKSASENDGSLVCACSWWFDCLTLSCECFSSENYCIESCTCINCLNKAEHEEIVLDARREIENKNPVSLPVGEANTTTPPAAWRKGGCHCKNSKCRKNYCQCYKETEKLRKVKHLLKGTSSDRFEDRKNLVPLPDHTLEAVTSDIINESEFSRFFDLSSMELLC